MERIYPGYETLALLGEGGGGTVYKARQSSTGQIVALKAIRVDSVSQAQAGNDLTRVVERFERETQLCAQLHHPNIVRLLDKGVTVDGHLFAVFEYVPGETLREHLARRGAMSAVEAGMLMGQVLDALACAHEQGIAHRDLKPQNIMISQTGARLHAKILDFGIAAMVPESRQADYRQLTMTREAIGTPSYSAPEQLRGEPPTTRTDLYAWGLLFIECLTGRPAIEGITLAEIYHKQLSAIDVPVPTALLGHPLGELLRRVTQKSPHLRAADARVLFQEFQKINLGNIVGRLDLDVVTYERQETGTHIGYEETSHAVNQPTLHMASDWREIGFERRQITVLCFLLNLFDSADQALDIDVMDALQRDQLNLCCDTARRFGGYFAGALADSVVFHFGFPYVTDSDSRRAARTALELISQVNRRSRLLSANHGVSVEIRIGLHTGIVLSRPSQTPDGLAVNTAMRLARLAIPGKILTSEATRRRLEPYILFEESSSLSDGSLGLHERVFEVLGEYELEAQSFLRTGLQQRALVGREPELGKLRQGWNACREGDAFEPALILADAGFGKSRLVYELAHDVREQAYPVLECACLPEQQNHALFPFLHLIRVLLRLNEFSEASDVVVRLQQSLHAAGMEESALLVILCAWLGVESPSGLTTVQYSPDRQKRMLLETLVNLLRHRAGAGPSVLIVEDLHWCDSTSLELIELLMARGSQTHQYLVMTARPDFAHAWHDRQPCLLRLAQLDDDQCGALLRRLLGNKTLEARSLARLVERVDGVPLFAEEMVRMLLEDARLIERDGVYVFDTTVGENAIPITLRDSLAERLNRLGPARETVWIASAIGREFSHQLLVDVAVGDESIVQAHLEQLIQTEVIYRQRRVDGDSYVFRHALIRDAAYDSMPRQTRERTHLRIASAMQSRVAHYAQGQLARLAFHFSAGNDFANAARYGTDAALWDMQRSLHDEAIAQADLVLGWIQRLPTQTQASSELAINQILIHELMQRFGWANARVKDVCERSLSLVETQGSSESSVPLLWALTVYHNVASHRATVRDLTDRLSDIAQASSSAQLRIAAQTMKGVRFWIDGQYQDASIAFYQVLHERQFANLEGEQSYLFGVDPGIWAESALAQVLWFCSDDDGAALSCAESAVERARSLGHVPSLGIALMYLGLVHQYAGRTAETKVACDELLILAQKYGLPAVEGYGAIIHAWATNDLAAADRMLGVLNYLGCMLGMSYYASLPADTEAKSGDFDGAITRISAALELSDRIEEPYYRAELLRRRAQYRMQRGDEADQALVVEDLEKGLGIAQTLGMKRTESMIRCDLALVLRTVV